MLDKIKTFLESRKCDVIGTCDAVYNQAIAGHNEVEEKARAVGRKLRSISTMDIQSIGKP